MRTLVISDLHLGAHSEVDVLRRPAGRDALLDALDGVDRLVILGDLLELRHGPLRDALQAARPVLAAIGQRLGPDSEVVLTPGNHDFGVLAPWLERRSREGATPLGLEEHAGPDASPATRAIADALAPAALDVAYPGLWLDDGVYATHGHYLDRHVTVPSLERLGSAVLGRLLRAPGDQASSPDDYELVLAPMYALLDAIAARVDDGRAAAPGNASVRAWQELSGNGRRGAWRSRLLAGAFPVGIGALNRVGLGPLRADLSGPELRRAALRAMAEVVAHLRIDARHVLFGHTHRAGPLPADEPGEWRLPNGGALLNTGCWVFESMYLDRDWGSPYWPGGAALLDAGQPPRLLRLLDGVDAAKLRPPGAPARA